MVSHSKLKLVECCPCSAFIHPWSHHCIRGIMIMFLSCLKGSFKLLVTVYGIKTVMKRNWCSHKNGFNLLKALIQSTIYGSLTGTGFVIFNCILRNILGRFTYKTLGFVSGLLTGLVIFLEHPSQRGLMISSFLQMAMGLKMTELNNFEYLKLTRKNAVLIFMICNSIIMFLIKTYSKIVAGHWFFDPASPEYQPKNLKSPRIKSIMKDGIKYFAVGVGFSLLRKILECITLKQKSVQIVISATQKSSFYGPGMFLGLYIIAYQALNYILEESIGVKSQLSALISGFFAGSSSWFIQPNLPLLSTSLASITLMLCKVVNSKMNRPLKFHGEMIYIICCGIIFEARALRQDICPQIVKEVLSTATNKSFLLILFILLWWRPQSIDFTPRSTLCYHFLFLSSAWSMRVIIFITEFDRSDEMADALLACIFKMESISI